MSEIIKQHDSLLHFKNLDGSLYWYKYDKYGNCIKITEQEFEKIEYNIKIREYLSRTKCSRFELIEI